MPDKFKLKENYRLALCCRPEPGEAIAGFLKPDIGVFSVHKPGCANLRSIEKERLIDLDWGEIMDSEPQTAEAADPALGELDEIDLRILRHHAEMGVDYAAVVAKGVKVDRETVFKRLRKLRDLKLISRVEPRVIQYRKNIVNNKWIKHRNHTYYEITERGRLVLLHLADRNE